MDVETMAREAAEQLVTCEEHTDEIDGAFFLVKAIGVTEECCDDDEADRLREVVRDALAVALAAFARRLLCCPVPGPVGEERLAEIRGWLAGDVKGPAYIVYDAATNDDLASVPIDQSPASPRLEYQVEVALAHALRDQKQHIDHLEALLRDCAADGLLAVRQQGYEAGLKEGVSGRAG